MTKKQDSDRLESGKRAKREARLDGGRLGRRPRPVLSDRDEALARLEAFDALAHELNFQRWMLAVVAGLTREDPPPVPLRDETDAQRLELARVLHVDAASGMLPAWLVDILDRYRKGRDPADNLTRRLLWLSWEVVLGKLTHGNATKVAKHLGADARASAVAKALEKRAEDDDMRCKNVYFALAKGSSARYQESARRGVRQPLFRLIRAAKSDISDGGNVTSGPAESGRNDRQPP